MNIWGHFKTITRHRHEVIKNCRKAGILWQGLRHDLSKYTPAEFISGAKYYQGDRSPNDMERSVYGYSSAWMHHKGRNKHHFEYWTDYDSKTKKYGPVKMPIKYVKEMFCDRLAASKIYQGEKYISSHPYEYFNLGRERRLIHQETSDLIERLLIMLMEDGEEKTFEYLKNLTEY